jgi:hypothetical protein
MMAMSFGNSIKLNPACFGHLLGFRSSLLPDTIEPMIKISRVGIEKAERIGYRVIGANGRPV